MNKTLFLLFSLLLPTGLNASPKEDTLVFCSEASPEGFNPMLYATTTTFDATTDTIYSRLLQFSKSSAEFDLRHSLSSHYTVSEDGKDYTFYLRKNVPFHRNTYFSPQRPFNADDVIFTVMRQADPNHPYSKVSQGTYLYYKRMNLDKNLKSLEKVDDYTVTFHLNEPDAQFLSSLAMANMSIQSAEYAEHMLKKGQPEIIDQQPIGTGPFQFIRYIKDASIRYQAFDRYFAGKQKLDHLIFSITPDPSVRAAKLLRGECHVMAYPNPNDLPKLKASADIVILEKTSLNTAYLALNTQKSPLYHYKVRQALSLAMNKAPMVEAIYQGYATMADNILPPDMKYYEPLQNTYDPQKAKQLLREAGFESGFSLTLWAMPVSRPYNPNAKRMAEMIQADWGKIGVKAQIVSFEWAEYLKRARNGEHEALLIGWSAMNAEPENFLETLFHCNSIQTHSNYARFCDLDYDTLLTQAKHSISSKQRSNLFKQLQQSLSKKLPVLPIAHSKILQPLRKEVKNFSIHFLQSNDFKDVYLEKAQIKSPDTSKP